MQVAPGDPIGVLLAIAAGAVLASIADTVMPEAYREGGPYVAFATAAGFLVSYALSAEAARSLVAPLRGARRPPHMPSRAHTGRETASGRRP